MKRHLLIFLFVLPYALTEASSPTPERPPTLFQTLLPTFFPFNDAATALFPPVTFGYQTPIALRYTLFNNLGNYEGQAACHRTALSFFGVKDNIDPNLCNPLSQLIIYHLILLRLTQSEFPIPYSQHAAFLRSAGLILNSRETNLAIENGFANMVANRAINYFSKDGWNSLGDINAQVVRRPFSDYTNYSPVNFPGLPLSDLRKPLRWQPLSAATDNSPGEYVFQQHVVPFLGTAKPLALTAADIASRNTTSPYKTPERRDTVSAADRRKLDRHIANYFRISRQLTEKQKFQAFFWENKFLSLGDFLIFYTGRVFRFDRFTVSGLALSEAIAQHDALIVAWNEKRRHDLVRPTTIIRKLWAGRQVSASVGLDGGVQTVRVEEYEPLIPVQPHSEFPSASAVLCTATLENVDIAIKNRLGQNVTFPPYVLPGNLEDAPVLGAFLSRFNGLKFQFRSLREAERKCGQSRLWAGVHFGPSVKEGHRIGRGIGKKALDQMEALMAGRVPDNCERCL